MTFLFYLPINFLHPSSFSWLSLERTGVRSMFRTPWWGGGGAVRREGRRGEAGGDGRTSATALGNQSGRREARQHPRTGSKEHEREIGVFWPETGDSSYTMVTSHHQPTVKLPLPVGHRDSNRRSVPSWDGLSVYLTCRKESWHGLQQLFSEPGPPQ